MIESQTILSTSHLTRKVSSNGSSLTIVEDFSFDFRRGEFYTILGPSGAGKSSLLRVLNRLDPVSEGEILYDGQDTGEIDPCELRQRIGYLFQIPYLFAGTVGENICYGNSELEDTEVHALAGAVRLDDDLIGAPVDNLSVGEKQRVALARLLATNPSVALLDEPTSALDPARTEAIETLIKEMVAERQLTVIMVSHDPFQTIRMGGTALLMVAGKLVEYGPPEQVINDPQTELGRKFKDHSVQ